MSLSLDNDVERFDEGSVIFDEGDKADHFYLVKSGRIRIVSDTGDRLIPLATISERDILGEMSVFGGEKRSATAIAVEQTVLVKIKNQDITNQLKKCADWVKEIMTMLADKLRHADEIIKEHKLVDDRLGGGNALTPQEEKKLKEIINKHRKK